MSTFYNPTPTNFYDDYIAHHGILGMKWGKQNGPPYPLGSGDHSKSERSAGWTKSLGGGRNEEMYDRKRKFKAANKVATVPKKKDRHERAADASSRDAEDLRKHGYKEEADAVQKVSDKQRAKSKTANDISEKTNNIVNKRKNLTQQIDKAYYDGDYDTRRILYNELFYEDKEIFQKMEEGNKTLSEIKNISKETIDEGSPYYWKAYEEYSKKHGKDDYGFSHYEWGKGNPHYDSALKEYKSKSKELESKYDNILNDITNSIVSDENNKSVKWDNGVQYTYKSMIKDSADSCMRHDHDKYKRGKAKNKSALKSWYK